MRLFIWIVGFAMVGEASRAGQVLKVRDDKVIFQTLDNFWEGKPVYFYPTGDDSEPSVGIVEKRKDQRGRAVITEGRPRVGDRVEVMRLPDEVKSWWLGVGYDFGGRMQVKAKGRAAGVSLEIDDDLPVSGASTLSGGYLSLNEGAVGWGWFAGSTGTRKTGFLTEKTTGVRLETSHQISYLLDISLNYSFRAMGLLHFLEGELSLPSVTIKDLSGRTSGHGLGYGFLFKRNHGAHLIYRILSSEDETGTFQVDSLTLSYRYYFR